MVGGLTEKCAVAGEYGANAGVGTAEALIIQENRGGSASGIGGCDENGKLYLVRESGAAGDVWNDERKAALAHTRLRATVGHNRYATSGHVDAHHQPAEWGDGDRQILVAHNGNLSDTRSLAGNSVVRGIPIHGVNDSEMMTRAIADRVGSGASIADAVQDTFPLLKGAFSTAIVSKDRFGEPVLTAFRDRHGVRPLALGRTAGGLMVASETMGLQAAGAEFIRDIKPGEMISITPDNIDIRQLADPDPHFDMFELIYFSRPDSEFKGVPIADIRHEMGRQLALEHGDKLKSGSLVVGIPASAVPFGIGFAEGCPEFEYGQVITKNPEVGRTFMAPTQAQREELRDRKYIFDGDKIYGRDIIFIDDSIVRNTTAEFLTRKLLEHGARSVSVLSGSPPIRFPNFYGIDTPEQWELVASHKDIDEIREDIGCDYLGYLSLEGMMQAVYNTTGEPPENFEVSCFTGIYPIMVDPRSLGRIRQPASMRYVA